MADLQPGEWAQISVPVDEDPFLAVATRAETPDGPHTILLARTLEPVAESTELVTGLLAVGVPLLIVVVGATTWLIVGLALAPVEAMRREVDEISAAELHRRVPAPSSSDEIARLAKTMNRMLERLERAQAMQRQLVADTSHELRSPIASIRQHAEVALAHPERSSPEDLAATVHAEALRLQRLVDDLLLLARVDERSLELARRPVDLDDIVFEEANRLRGLGRLGVDTSAVSAGRVNGDEGGLRRVVANLVENAARHARGRVAFSLAARDESIVLHVDDDGAGIPPADRRRIFDRFVRLDAARDRDAGGSGLGLAIVAELVTAHEGTVAVTDSPLGGARIEVRLPRGDAD
jgi:signal transduction histidine kinase